MLLSTRQGRVLALLGIVTLLAALSIWAAGPALGAYRIDDGSPMSASSVPQSTPLTWLPSRTDGFEGTYRAVYASREIFFGFFEEFVRTISIHEIVLCSVNRRCIGRLVS